MTAMALNENLPAAEQLATVKFSRYRSVQRRNVAADSNAPDVPILATSPPKNEAIARSRSRYHRPSQSNSVATQVHQEHHAPVSLNHNVHPPLPRGSTLPPGQSVTISRNLAQRAPSAQKRVSRDSGWQSHTVSPPTAYVDARQEASAILLAEAERLRRLKEKEIAAREKIRARERLAEEERERARQEEANRIARSEQQKQEQQQQQKRMRSTTISDGSTRSEKATASQRDSLRTRLRSLSRPKSPSEPTSPNKRKFTIGNPIPIDVTRSMFAGGAPPSSPKKVIETKAPAFDAPISAINAGDRRVSVRCNKSSITLPVTPTTTARDLLYSASICMSEEIEIPGSVLIEDFSQLGLERPLRQYEHIRDVLNSWDYDGQNSVTIVSSLASGHPEALLEADAVSRDEPDTISVHLYHSSVPGKWSKRYIRLANSGQVSLSKMSDPATEADSTNICHLSDFDIYNPTASQLQQLRVPRGKKFCYAIKSNQKSSMFLTGATFVNFFATSDSVEAQKFYKAIQQWRSWYLINVLGEGKKGTSKPVNALEALKERPETALSAKSDTPYQLGSFMPLLDLDVADLMLGFDLKASTADNGAKKPMTRQQQAPPTSFPSSFNGGANGSGARSGLVSLVRSPSTSHKRNSVELTRPRSSSQKAQPDSAASPFTGTGLIARVGSRRVPNANSSAASHNNLGDSSSEAAFTGKGLLARAASQRRAGAGAGHGHGVAGVEGQPLVDLSLGSMFADGSLLRQVESWRGDDERGLVVDRVKKREVGVRVGEGFA